MRPWQWIIHERSTNSSMVMLLSLFRPLCLPALMKLVAIEGKVDHNTPEQERQDGLPVGYLPTERANRCTGPSLPPNSKFTACCWYPRSPSHPP